MHFLTKKVMLQTRARSIVEVLYKMFQEKIDFECSEIEEFGVQSSKHELFVLGEGPDLDTKYFI